MTGYHEFAEDLNDSSMCMCGIPAMTHRQVYQTPPPPGPSPSPDSEQQMDEAGATPLAGEVRPTSPAPQGATS